MRENGFKEGISCEQRRHDSLLLRTTIALHDHEFSPRFRVLRLLTAPSEMRLGNICIRCARERPLRPQLSIEVTGDGLPVDPGSAELLRREVRPCAPESV